MVGQLIRVLNMDNKCLYITVYSILLSFILISDGFGFGFLFSNKGYADRITVQARIASYESLDDLIAKKEKTLNNIPEETNRFLKKAEPHLFIRIKNHGNAGAWGELSCSIDNQYWVSMDVDILGPGMTQWRYYVTPIKSIQLLDNDDYPKVITKWVRLYSK